MRHQDHKICHESLVPFYPPREEGLPIPSDGYPVHVAAAVGVASWMLPRVNILDMMGLNDYVIARLPAPAGEARQMAHDRHAPKDYVFCFYPNVFIDGRNPLIRDRKIPLTPDQIIRCESEWQKYVRDIRTSGNANPTVLERFDRWLDRSPVNRGRTH